MNCYLLTFLFCYIRLTCWVTAYLLGCFLLTNYTNSSVGVVKFPYCLAAEAATRVPFSYFCPGHMDTVEVVGSMFYL